MTLCKRMTAAAALVAGALIATPAAADDTATAVLHDQDGEEVGLVKLQQTPNGVLLDAAFVQMPPGHHGFHIHETGKCEPPFKSAGGHYNPTDAKHGYLVEGGPHAGDMPNIRVPDTGVLNIEVFNPMVSLDGENPLLDEDGSAIMIHSGPDDYKSQPAGDAGDRIACGVVTTEIAE